ncbi:hypothetical protein LUX73_42345 [Actinomadura madurae]|nr:hypothetical protein [Actinomadura madurae]MCQ0010690.1 hypothetical protein [Actinomadura madurae]
MIATASPECAAFSAATFPSRAFSLVLKEAAFAEKTAASSGEALASAAEIRSASRATEPRSYQTCSFSSSPAGAVFPEISTASSTSALEPAPFSRVPMKSS